MSVESIRSTLAGRGALALLLGLAVALAGCGLDEVEIPDLGGPSTHALSLVVTANPDILLADAESLAVVRATVRGPDGQGLGGRPVFFQVTDENGAYVDLGTLQSSTAPVQFPAPQVTEVTDPNGIAQVVYRVPGRISVTAIQTVHIFARLVGDDAQGFQDHFAQIQLRPAEVRRYPESPNTGPPSCDFNIDPEVGPNNGAYPTRFVVRFRTTSRDVVPGQIIQYFWDFGDGFQSDLPDIDHHWLVRGDFTVTHVVTDNHGVSVSCSKPIKIDP